MLISDADYLAHYGILRKSGRYPWGSGGTQEARNRTFLETIEQHRKDGWSEAEIARNYDMSTGQLRALKSIAKNEEKAAQMAQAQRLKDKGLSNVAIGQRMNLNESSVRALLAPGQQRKTDILETTANMLKEQVAEKKYVDIGIGTELHLGISKEKLAVAVSRLKEEGYEVHTVQIPQLGTTQQTLVKVLAPPGTTYLEVKQNRNNIGSIAKYSNDGGVSYNKIQPPLSISSKRVGIRYKEDGGADADGVIYVRPGVPDVSLGGNRYAQVRIAVDGTHFIKGMAVYKDNLPAGVDLEFNTNKSNTGNKLDALKPLKADKDLPFGAMISRQVTKTHGGHEKVTSVMNIVNDEGDWERWSRTLSSQMLSKQPTTLAKTQLDMTYERRRKELDDIVKLTNPSVKQKLLEEFADSADSAAIHLKAAAIPKQKTHVILPINSMKETEVYAPNYKNGEMVALVRFPHGGRFEIPELRVNNRNEEARKIIGSSAKNAIGIHSKVAQRLSGADFDGDTVLVIPNNDRRVKTAPALEGLKGFDPQARYPKYEGMVKMDARTKGIEMGKVSNLITDMTIQGASNTELAAAVRHSMVVIDAEKHELNWKQSAIDNGIPNLMQKYQKKKGGGASTIISKKKGTVDVPERKASTRIDPSTGEKVFIETGASFVKNGKVIQRTSKVNRLGDAKDAHSLSSGTKIEAIYADHSNRMKALANEARKISVATKGIPQSPSAKTAYAKEVATLDAKLNIALRNAPLERQAQVIANGIVSQKRQSNPDMEASELKKVKSLALTDARIRTGAKKNRIQITDSEWTAIQAGAISPSKLSKILDNADMDVVREHAAPKSKVLMTSSKTQRAQQMLASGYTQAEVAEALGVSLTTLKNSISE